MKRIAFCIGLALFAPVAYIIHADMAAMAESKRLAAEAHAPPPVLFASAKR